MKFEEKTIDIRRLLANSGQLDGVPANPRKVSKKDMERLRKSLREFPGMLHLRELVVVPHGGDYVVLGGNQRLAAAKAEGFEDMPCKVLAEDTPPEVMRQFVIRDNQQAGEDDWDVLAEWDATELQGWGVDLAPTAAPSAPTDVELKPFRKNHLLLSYDIDCHDKVAEAVFGLAETLGDRIEVTTAAN